MQSTNWRSVSWRYEARSLLFGAVLLIGGSTEFFTGCARLSTNLASKDVNIVNGGEGTVAGRFAVDGPSGRNLLRKSYRLSGTKGDSAYVTYNDVLKEAGRYAISVTIPSSEGTPEDSVQKTVQITAPKKEHVMLKLDKGSNQPIEIESVGAFDEQ